MEITMSNHKLHNPRQVAIWIDHNEAFLAKFHDEQLTNEEEINSDVGPRTHGGGWSQHRIEAHRHEQLKHYYDEVVEHLGNVDEILILGPGQAKHELRTRIERHKGLRGKVVALRTTDKISEDQFIQEAEDYFGFLQQTS
jgi:peptide subunit release factor 1 (eRF1)